MGIIGWVYGRLKGWKSAEWFYKHDKHLYAYAEKNLKERKKLLHRQKFEKYKELVEELFERLRKTSKVPMRDEAVRELIDLARWQGSIEGNLKNQLACLNDTIDWNKVKSWLKSEIKNWTRFKEALDKLKEKYD
jgi:hypothetical protein